MKKFLVEVEEVFRKKVVVWADSTEEASKTTEEVCNDGVLDATVGFTEFSRNVSVLKPIRDDEAAQYPQVWSTESAVAVMSARVKNQ